MSTSAITSSITTSTGPLTQDPESTTGNTPALNFFFLLIVIAGVLIFSSLVYFSRRRSKRNNARQARNGRDALVQDVESWAGRNGRWGFRSAYQSPNHAINSPSRVIGLHRSGNDGSIDEEAALGLNESGEAPPPYGADKPPPMISRTSLVRPEVEMGPEARARTWNERGNDHQIVAAHRLPDYDQVADPEGNAAALTRPPVAVRPVQRVIDVESDEQGLQRERARRRAVDWEAQ